MGLFNESPHCDVEDTLLTIVDVEDTLVFSAHNKSNPQVQAKQQVVFTLANMEAPSKTLQLIKIKKVCIYEAKTNCRL